MSRLGGRAVLVALALALAASTGAAQTKKELVQQILKLRQGEFEALARNVVERPAFQMVKEADLAMRQNVAPEKREAMQKAIEVEVRKYLDESYVIAREHALKAAPLTIGAVLEEKMSEQELQQILVWLKTSAGKKYSQLDGQMQGTFLRRMLTEAQPAVDPKVKALDGKIRSILGVGPAPAAPSGPAAPPRPAPSAATTGGK